MLLRGSCHKSVECLTNLGGAQKVIVEGYAMHVLTGRLAGPNAMQEVAPHVPHRRRAAVDRTVSHGVGSVGPQSRPERVEGEAAVWSLFEHPNAGQRAEQAAQGVWIGLDLRRQSTCVHRPSK